MSTGLILLTVVVVQIDAANVDRPYDTPTAPAMHRAITERDYDRAMLLARLKRDPAKRVGVLLHRAEALRRQDLTGAKTVLHEAERLVRRYERFPEAKAWRESADRQVRRRLSEIAVAEADNADKLRDALDQLLDLLDDPTEHAAALLDAAMRMDGFARRDLAVEYLTRTVDTDGDSAIGRTAALAGRLLIEKFDDVHLDEISALLATLAKADEQRRLGYLLALLAERAWRGHASLPAASVETWVDQYASRLNGEESAASRHRLTVHRVIVARHLRRFVPTDELEHALAAAHKWLSTNGRVRDAADAALVVASLSPPGDVRNEWLAKARSEYANLTPLDQTSSRKGLQRVKDLEPSVSTALAAQFEAGKTADPVIEDERGFAVRVRAAYEEHTRQAFERGDFNEAFRYAQQAKLAELGIKIQRENTIGTNELIRRYVLDPETRQGPNVDLVVEYLVTERATYVFALRADAKRQVFEPVHARIDVERRALTRQVLDYVGSLDAPAPGAGRALSDLLLARVWGNWSGPWVVIAPDGPLRFLPFELLPIADGATLLGRVTVRPGAVEESLAKRSKVLGGKRPTMRQVLRARVLGIWPSCEGRVSYLATAAVLAKKSQATPDAAMVMWLRSADRLRREAESDSSILPQLGAYAPSLGNTTSNGLVLALWSEPETSALLSPSGRYVREVFSLGSRDYGGNDHGRMLGQLRRDLVEGYRVVKQGHSAEIVPLTEKITPSDWGRWIYVDLAPVRRPR